MDPIVKKNIAKLADAIILLDALEQDWDVELPAKVSGAIKDLKDIACVLVSRLSLLEEEDT